MMTTLQIVASLSEDSRGVIYAPRVFKYILPENIYSTCEKAKS